MPWVLNMSVLHRVSVENGTSYMFARVLSIPQIEYSYNARAWIYKGYKYAKVTQGSAWTVF